MNDPIDDLEAHLTRAALRRPAARMHARRWRWAAGLVIALSVSVPAAASVDLLDRLVRAGPPAPRDSAPASTPAVAARTSAADGAALGVATYRNAEGHLCAAFGHADARGRLVDRRGTEIPFKEAGNCTMRPDPAAVNVTSQFDDPTTPGNERSLIVWGLAADDVDEIYFNDRGLVSRPGRDGAFIVRLPADHGKVVLTLRRSDGTEQKLSLPSPPDLDDLNRRLKSGEIPRHHVGGP